MMNKKLLIIPLIGFITFQGCKNKSKTETIGDTSTEQIKLVSPEFNADSAYVYTKAQVDLGPRIPGTTAHQKCADFLVARLKSFGAAVDATKMSRPVPTKMNVNALPAACARTIASLRPDVSTFESSIVKVVVPSSKVKALSAAAGILLEKSSVRPAPNSRKL